MSDDKSSSMPLWVIAPVIAVFIAGFWTLWIAIENAPAEIDDPYQQRGDVSNKRFAADFAAMEGGLSASLTIDQNTCIASVLSPIPVEGPLTVTVRHATRSDLDWAATLEGDHDNVFSGPCGSYSIGNYYVRLAPLSDDWRLLGQWSGRSLVELAPRSLVASDP